MSATALLGFLERVATVALDVGLSKSLARLLQAFTWGSQCFVASFGRPHLLFFWRRCFVEACILRVMLKMLSMSPLSAGLCFVAHCTGHNAVFLFGCI